MVLRRLGRRESVKGLGSDEEGRVGLGSSRLSAHLLRTMLGAAGGAQTETEPAVRLL